MCDYCGILQPCDCDNSWAGTRRERAARALAKTKKDSRVSVRVEFIEKVGRLEKAVEVLIKNKSLARTGRWSSTAKKSPCVPVRT